MAWDRYGYGYNNPSRYTDPTGHFNKDEIKNYFGVDSWDDVLRVFQEGGTLEGRWGWLTVLQKAELGDEININWVQINYPIIIQMLSRHLLVSLRWIKQAD